VGSYLGIATTLAIFCGGVVRWLVDKSLGEQSGSESEISPGSLYASGLIAAGGIAFAVLIAVRLYRELQVLPGGPR